MPYNTTILAETSLVSYWQLAETSGTVAADSKDSNPGTYTGGFTLNQTAPGSFMSGAVLFNGTTGYVQVADAVNLQITAAVTLESWVKLTSAPRDAAYGSIITKGSATNVAPYDDYALYAEAPGKVFYGSVAISSTQYSVLGTSIPTAGLWYHVALTYDGSNVRLYVNGTLEATTPATGSLRSSLQPLLIGSLKRGGAAINFFPGTISNAAVYNIAISQSKITDHITAAGNPAARFSQDGLLVVQKGTPKDRESQTGLLVVQQGTPKDRESQTGLLVVQTGNPPGRVSQSGALGIYNASPPGRVSQSGALAIYNVTLTARVSQSGALVIVTYPAVAAPTPRKHSVSRRYW